MTRGSAVRPETTGQEEPKHRMKAPPLPRARQECWNERVMRGGDLDGATVGDVHNGKICHHNVG